MRPLTARLEDSYRSTRFPNQTGPVKPPPSGSGLPETGRNRLNSNPNSKSHVQPVSTGIPTGLTGLPAGMTGLPAGMTGLGIFYFFEFKFEF
jgi:hypothetical protein